MTINERNPDMSVKIIVDSTADLNEAIKDQVAIVPLTICFGEEEYVDGVTITPVSYTHLTLPTKLEV